MSAEYSGPDIYPLQQFGSVTSPERGDRLWVVNGVGEPFTRLEGLTKAEAVAIADLLTKMKKEAP